MLTSAHHITIKQSREISAWKYMRLSAILLVPMVWVHTILNTLIIGSDNISIGLVTLRWATWGWRIYDILLLTFAFSHGVNGLRQVFFDFAQSSTLRRMVNISMLAFWILLSTIGAAAILGSRGY